MKTVSYNTSEGKVIVLIAATTLEYLEWQIEEFRRNPTDDCILWPYSLANGYGQIHKDGTTVLAHRKSYELFYGTPLTDQGLHSCDTRPCINPWHIRDGSARDNTNDMLERRGPSISKLAESDVMEIIELLDAGVLRQVDIAKRFDITQGMVSHINRGRAWIFLSDNARGDSP